MSSRVRPKTAMDIKVRPDSSIGKLAFSVDASGKILDEVSGLRPSQLGVLYSPTSTRPKSAMNKVRIF